MVSSPPSYNVFMDAITILFPSYFWNNNLNLISAIGEAPPYDSQQLRKPKKDLGARRSSGFERVQRQQSKDLKVYSSHIPT